MNIQMSQKRQDSLPLLYARGSHYDIGYNVGRTFCGLIKTLIETHPSLNGEYLPVYGTPEGKDIYEQTYQCVNKYYPYYIKELQGMSDGADIPFYKLFLLHMDDVLPSCVEQRKKQNGCQGCSSVCLNEPNHEILGHTEDGFKEVLNNIYILDAHITETQPEQRFTTLCYAGLLPGYAMGFNKHGLLYSVNILGAKHLGQGKLPRSFVSRHLLTADSLESALTILRCKGCSIADAMSINLTFLNQTGDRLFHNIEVSPTYPISNESALSVLTISPGEVIFHANKFLRLQLPQKEDVLVESSNARHVTREHHVLCDKKSVHELLGDTSHCKHSIFQNKGAIYTVAVGIFDCIERTWTLYLDNPKTSAPIAVINLDY